MINDQITEEMLGYGGRAAKATARVAMGASKRVAKLGFSICIKLAKLTAKSLKRAFVNLGPKICDRIKSGVNGNEKTLNDLKDEGKDLEDVDISNINLGNLKHILRKYDIDLCVKVDKNAQTPTYYCFFKSNDPKRMLAAVQEYGDIDKRARAEKNVTMMYPSLRDKIRDFIQKARGMNRNRERVFIRQANRGR